jgi:hypothetical protein
VGSREGRCKVKAAVIPCKFLVVVLVFVIEKSEEIENDDEDDFSFGSAALGSGRPDGTCLQPVRAKENSPAF